MASADGPCSNSQSLSALREGFKPRYVDIGINLTDSMYRGIYNGKTKHAPDSDAVISRAESIGCSKLICTGSDLQESKEAISLARRYPGTLYATVGVHPCSVLKIIGDLFEDSSNPEDSTGLPAQALEQPENVHADQYLRELRDLAIQAKDSGHCVAFGEIGLDYDRLHYSPANIQREYFEKQMEIAVAVQLPLFLHSRAAHADFLQILNKYAERLPRKGVVHSFTGSSEEMKQLVAAGWDIGVNGCSLKTTENCKVVQEIPLERMQIETDGPWCSVNNSHASADILKAMGFRGKSGWAALDVPDSEERPHEPSSGTQTPVDGTIAVEPKHNTNGVLQPPPGTKKGPGGKKGNTEKAGEVGEWPAARKPDKFIVGGTVKGRNEACFIPKVAWTVAGIKNIPVEEVIDKCWKNSCRMFELGVDLLAQEQ